MLKRCVGYAYPWDFEGDAAAAGRAAELGLDAVALAASYHATRAGTPLHPGHRVVDVAWAACYVPVRADAWRGHRLVPLAPTWTRSQDSFGDAHRQLTEQGLAVDAWIVLTHNLALGRAHPDLVVRSAYGDAYPYGLCPAAQDVKEYCATLVEEVLRAAPVSGVVLESCGAMGFDHAGEHEKTEFAGWDPVQRALMSICFCPACTRRYVAEGIEVHRLSTLIRAAVETGSSSFADALGELAPVVARVRTSVASELRTLLVRSVESVSAAVRVTLHGSADPWTTGSFATVYPAVGDRVDSVVATCWDVASGTDQIRDLRALAPTDVDVGAYLRLDRDWDAGELTDSRLHDFLEAGMGELHLYHVGLLGERGLRVLREVVERTRKLATPASG